MVGLLNSGTPWAGLAQQLRAQAPNADWNAQGIDRADELAQMLYSKGVTDLSQMSLKKGVAYDSGGQSQILGTGESAGDVMRPEIAATHNTDGMALDFGNGLTVGNLGDRGKSSDAVLATGTDKGGLGELGWSSAGHGNVGYVVEQGPDGKVQIVPKWGSSATDSLEAARGVAAVLGAGALGASGLLGNGLAPTAAGSGSAGLTAGGIESVALPSASTMAGSLPEITAGAGTGAAATGGGLLGGEALTAAAPEVSFGAGSVANPYGMTGGLVENAATDAALTTGTYGGGNAALGANVFGDALAGGGVPAATFGDMVSGGIRWMSKNLLEPVGLTGREAARMVSGGMNNAAQAKAQATQSAFTTSRDQAGWAHDAQLQSDKFNRMRPVGGLLAPYLQRG